MGSTITPEQIAAIVTAVCTGIAGIIWAARRGAKKADEPKDKADVILERVIRQEEAFIGRLAKQEAASIERHRQLLEDHRTLIDQHRQILSEEEETRAEVRKVSDTTAIIAARTRR